MTHDLRDRLTDLADSATAPTDLLDGALARAARHRRRRAAGIGVASLGVAAVTVTPFLVPVPWLDAGAPAASSPAQPSPGRSPVPLEDLPVYSPPATPPAPEIPEALGTVERAVALVVHDGMVDAVDAAGERTNVLRMPSPSAGAMISAPNTASLSPDGTKLALPSTALTRRDDTSGIWILDLRTGEGKLYGTGGVTTMSVQWSPTGDKLWARRYGGGGAWILDTATGAFEQVPGIADGLLFWAAADRLVTGDGAYRVIDPAGRLHEQLPQLAEYVGGGARWTPAEFGGWSPDGRFLAVQSRGTEGSTFAAADVATGRIVRSWGPVDDPMSTQNIVGWSDPDTMLVMIREPDAGEGIQLWEFDVDTGERRQRADYPDADSVFVPVNIRP